MGSVSFTKTVLAATAGEAYDMLKEEAEHENGHNQYNGTISTCDMGRLRKSFPVYNDDSKLATREFIRQDGNGRKWVADYVDMGVKHYVVREIQMHPQEVTAKYLQKYAVCDFGGVLKPVSQHTFDKKTDAIADAKAQALLGRDGIVVCKMPIKQSGSNVAMEIRVNERTTTEKPKHLKKGQTAIPMHMFCFYGWASE